MLHLSLNALIVANSSVLIKFMTRQVVLLMLLMMSISLFAQNDTILSPKDYNSFEEMLVQINEQRLQNPDIAIKSLDYAYRYYLEQRDTLLAVRSLTESAINYGHLVQYQNAYDNLWNALFLADESQDDEAIVLVYLQLGRYYSFYKRKDTAIDYLNKALNLNKKMVEVDSTNVEELIICYYTLAYTYRELGDGDQAKFYLDSCYMHLNGNIEYKIRHYLDVEYAQIQSINGNYQEAINSLLKVEPWFEKNSPSFRVLLFTYLGDHYLKIGNLKLAEQYFEDALNISDKYKSHLDYIPTIHKRLSSLYANKGDYKKAFNSQKLLTELDAKYFDSRSEYTSTLLEIKDEFRLTKETQQKIIQKQRIAQLENEEKVNFLENSMLLVSIVFLLFAGLLFFQFIRKKHKIEKSLNKKRRALEKRQAQELREIERKQSAELLELKNKELATSSLKLIEKDGILESLKDRLKQNKGDINAAEVNKIVRSISHSNSQNWDEFESRFLSINRNFYETLNKNYPKLSRGDQKLCALVKLNLSSKEMAKLMGISLESVHTNRYRLRKKLKLTKDVSLTEFVAKL